MARRPYLEDPLQIVGVAPEQALIVALLRTLLTDATRTVGQQVYANDKRAQWRDEARIWLQDKEAVMFWLDLASLPEETYGALLKVAGLEEPCD